MNDIAGIAYCCNSPEKRIETIKAILNRGNIVCFTGGNGIKKYVIEWNEDSDGDLTADYSTGQSNFVCLVAAMYSISEIKPIEYEKIKKDK
jgi:hypothetical protein